MPTVSVVIPCYNGARFLADAVASVRAQTYPVHEIFVVDDHSTDDSLMVAGQLGVTVLRTPRNGGAGPARNLGMLRATGDVVAFLDCDDEWDAIHLETVVPLLERFPEAVLAFSRVRLVGDRQGEWRKPMPEHQPTFVLWESMAGAIAPMMTAVARREVLLRVDGFDPRMRYAEDFDLFVRLAREGPFVCTHAVTASYRQHGAQTTHHRRGFRRDGWAARRRWWEAWGRDAEPAVRDRFAAALRASWELHVYEAWRDGAAGEFHELMAHGAWVPGTADTIRRWRRKGHLLGAMRVWRSLPLGVQRTVRRIAGRAIPAPPPPPASSIAP